jgi:sentrin-specific protease 1
LSLRIPSTPLYEAHLARQAELDVEMGARRAVTIKKVPTSVTLPSDAKKIIEGASWKDDDEVLITKFNIEFRRRDLNTLISPHWLNDEVINFYMQLLSERAERNLGIFPSIHVFSTFFYPKLRDRGYQMVRTSTRRINPSVLSRDLILFPIHLGMHWCMATIDFRSKTISYYDSLHATNLECLSVVEEWLARESMDKASTEFDFTGWTKICPKTIPAQQNGYDCGVFALVLAEHITRDASFSFSQKDMLYWRDRISYEILLGKLLDIK